MLIPRPAYALLLLITACTEWHPVTLPAPADTDWSTAGHLRLTTVSGRELRGATIHLRNDSLVVRGDSLAAECGVPRVAVATIERSRFSGSKTAGLGVAIVGISIVLGMAVNSMTENMFSGGTIY